MSDSRRKRLDAEAREPEKPVDAASRPVPVAAEAPARPAPALVARPSLGQPVCPPAATISAPLAADIRRAELERATAFLKRQCILVQVVDRDDLVRRYRVSGRREPMYLEGVVELAIAKGMEPRA